MSMNVGALKRAARGAANRNARAELVSANRKFHPGPNPLELEQSLKIITPTDKQQLQAMIKMIDQLYKDRNATPAQQNALEMWKFQIASGTIADTVKLQFLRRFYFWLLGRGTETDTAKTLWGRGNAAVYNPEVAAYIDQFSKKRTEYSMQLALLANRVPETLNGYYLYFKYIVNGSLKRVTDANGASFWDMSNEDFLEDFDLFQQSFDKDYADLVAPSSVRGRDAPTQPPFTGPDPYPQTVNAAGIARAKEYAFNQEKASASAVAQLDSTLAVSSTASAHKKDPSVGEGTEAVDEGLVPETPTGRDAEAIAAGDIGTKASSAPPGVSEAAPVTPGANTGLVPEDVSSIKAAAGSPFNSGGEEVTPLKPLPPKDKEEMTEADVALERELNAVHERAQPLIDKINAKHTTAQERANRIKGVMDVVEDEKRRIREKHKKAAEPKV